MRFTVTVRALDKPDVEGDIELRDPARMTIAELAQHVREAIGAGSDTQISLDGAPLPATKTALAAGVRPGSHLVLGRPGADRPKQITGLQLRVAGGGDAGAVLGLTEPRIRIGRSREAELAIDDADISRFHAELRVSHDGIWLRDLRSTNGTHLDGRTLHDAESRLPLDTVFRVGNSRLFVSGVNDPPATISELDGLVLVHRPNRMRHTSVETIDFPPAPADRPRPSISVLAALLPTALSVGLAVMFHNVQLLAFALLTPVSVLSTGATDRWRWRRQRRNDHNRYDRSRREAERNLAAAASAEERRLHRDLPDPASLSIAVRTKNIRLFERSTGDADFLHVRLGLADQQASCRGMTSGAEVSSPMLRAVPVAVSLRDGALGIAGPPPLVRGSTRWLVTQLAALHSPNDLAIYLIARDAEPWRWLRWLPGFRLAAETDDRARELVAEVRAELCRRGSRPHDTGVGLPWILLLIEPWHSVGPIPGLADLLADGWRSGVTAIVLDEQARSLPPACPSSAVYDSDDPATLTLQGPGGAPVDHVTADRVGLEYAEQLSRGLAPIRDAQPSVDDALRPTARLLDLLHLTDASAVELSDRWSGHDMSPRLPIGITANSLFEIDLTMDGPHVLIAGSTGSGKSELLRSLVISLAVSLPPNRLSLVLIDYKGGAAFAGCAHLPHTSAVITDLDPATTRRALLSIEAELRRRESAFSRAGVDDLSAYERSSHSRTDPIARLVLVVDEFAALADELPDFLNGLLGIAQRGRSLGVNLVLATQRPGRVVSADMRANMPLRIAMRVTDAAESSDVIGVESAAGISKARPGRGFAQLAQGLVEFQAARIDAPVPSEDPAVRVLDAWNRPQTERARDDDQTTDLDTICRLAQQAARSAGLGTVPPPWAPALPGLLPVADLRHTCHPKADRTEVVFALIDEPHTQQQNAARHDLREGGAIGLIGSPRSGRSSALRTFVAAAADSLAPDDLHCYVVDCGSQALSSLELLPHCGAVLSRHEPGGIYRLLELLSAEVASRQRTLARLGVTAVSELAGEGLPLPLIIIAIDGWEEFAAMSEDFDAGRSLAMLHAILRDAGAVGITVLLAGERALLGVRVASMLTRRFVLNLLDRTDYALAGIPAAALPRSMQAGRAVLAEGGQEVQFAVLDGDVSTAAQATRISEIAAKYGSPVHRPPIRVRSLPNQCEARIPLATSGQAVLGIGGDDARQISLDITTSDRRLLIVGPPGSGRTTALQRIGASATALGHRVIVVGEPDSSLAQWGRSVSARIEDPLAMAARGAPDDSPWTAALLLIDDAATGADATLADALTSVVAGHCGPVALAVRSDQLLMAFRGPVTELLRHRTGLLLQPSNSDREAFGLRAARPLARGIPGRGILATDSTRRLHPDGLEVQVATP